MFDPFSVCSYRGDYSVQFIPNIVQILREQVGDRDVIIIDKTVFHQYVEIAEFVACHNHLVIEPSESAKTYQALIPILDRLISNEFTKSDRLIAIGGGILQDITSFAASILFRGVNWVFFPTNLLAQCDSCIGSKTSINFGAYKNQLGGFYPPQAIYISTSMLKTLPTSEFLSGIGEMLHYFCVGGRDDLDWAKRLLVRALEVGPALDRLIYRSLSIKKRIIEIDEFDQGQRNVFNYGHSFGHALEAATDFAIPHGIAVTFGMDLANLISHRVGLIDIKLRNELREIFTLVWKDANLDMLKLLLFFDALHKDKKNEGLQIKVILTKGLGQMFKTTLSLDQAMQKFIQKYFKDRLWTIPL